LQAVGDSLFYSFRDSTFRFFKNPIVWAQENQIVGDTIYLFTENKKPKKFYAFENALAINKADKELYNQIKGNTITGLFKEGNIDFFRAKGNAENIYYTEDEQGGFIGANRSTSDVMDVTFQDKKPYKIVFRNNLQGTISPIKQVNNTEMRVRGFKWYDAKRPKTKYDLLGN
ncbi:MAG: OstA-like protein, partial [Segetibacter sp.]